MELLMKMNYLGPHIHMRTRPRLGVENPGAGWFTRKLSGTYAITTECFSMLLNLDGMFLTSKILHGCQGRLLA